MEEILVIGGAGFVGNHLVRMLHEEGNTIRVFSRSAGKGSKPTPGIRYIQGQTSDAGAIDEAVRGTQVVYDLSLGARNSMEDMQRDYIQATQNLAQAAKKHRVRRLIYTGTTASLDLGRKGKLDESDGTDPNAEKRPGFYHLGKIRAEEILFNLHKSEGLPAVVLRPAVVVGRGGKLTHSGLGIWRDDNCCLVIGKGEHPLPFVLVEDVARAFVLAKDAPGIEGKAFNLVGDVRPSAKEMIGYIRERSRRNFRMYTLDIRGIYMTEVVKHLAKLAVGRPTEMPNWGGLKWACVTAQIDTSGAKNALGWKPVSDLETFLREAVDSHLRPIPEGDLRLERVTQR